MTEFFELLESKIPIAMQMYGLLYTFVDTIGDYDYSEYEPSLKMDINDLYGYSGEVTLIDFSWYSPYRDTVHLLLSAFMWLWFAVSTYRYIPKMIGGI